MKAALTFDVTKLANTQMKTNMEHSFGIVSVWRMARNIRDKAKRVPSLHGRCAVQKKENLGLYNIISSHDANGLIL